jgi:hypothetical protein
MQISMHPVVNYSLKSLYGELQLHVKYDQMSQLIVSTPALYLGDPELQSFPRLVPE